MKLATLTWFILWKTSAQQVDLSNRCTFRLFLISKLVNNKSRLHHYSYKTFFSLVTLFNSDIYCIYSNIKKLYIWECTFYLVSTFLNPYSNLSLNFKCIGWYHNFILNENCKKSAWFIQNEFIFSNLYHHTNEIPLEYICTMIVHLVILEYLQHASIQYGPKGLV